MKRILYAVALLACATPAFAQFNPSQPYATTANSCGQIFSLQGGVYYDRNGVSQGSTLPTCNPPVSLGSQSASNVSITGGSISGLNPAMPVASGGTGSASLAAHGVLVGAGTSAVTIAAPGNSGIPLVSQGAIADPIFTNITPAGGGTGLTSITAHGVMIGEGTSAVAVAGPGASGLPLVGGGASADPTFATLGVAGGGTGATTASAAAGNLGVPPVYSNAGVAVTTPHIVEGQVTLVAGTVSVTFSGAAVFTSTLTYQCTVSDLSTTAAAANAAKQSGTSVTFYGSGTDTVGYICVGN
ncbi:hypothetical protein [Paraburkholderia rhynchosiae]|nr:hypothetical protein [Paraburkholderia rhynchosiae]CAB3730986.1 hypothetical protein LMG27174_05796 [Paraburkholderia rhynchosiae]